jgi:hypothetical protein
MEVKPERTSFFMNKIPPFLLDGVKTCRLISGLIILIGIILIIGGTSLSRLSHMGISSYEKSSGKLLRAISNSDKANYKKLKSLSGFGKVLQVIGLVTAAFGLTLILKPHYLLPVFGRLGLISEQRKEIPP